MNMIIYILRQVLILNVSWAIFWLGITMSRLTAFNNFPAPTKRRSEKATTKWLKCMAVKIHAAGFNH